MIEVRIPDIGGATDVEVIEVLRAVGDNIEIDDELITLETDKATMEIPAPAAGVLKALKVEPGSKVSEGDLIALLEAADTKPKDDGKAPAAASSTETAAAESPTIQAHQTLHTETAPITPSRTQPAVPSAGAALPYTSPSLRKLARELLVPITSVTGTGPKGRITRDDIYSYVKTVMSGQAQGSVVVAGATGTGTVFTDLPPWPKVDFEQFGPVERKQLPRIRKLSGANLHRNWVTIPHVTNHEDADITELEAFRQQLNKENQEAGIKVTLLAFLVKAAVAALKALPEFNASLDGREIVLKHYYHIGFAADTPNGLVVPVIRDADQKGILALASEMSTLAAKAREGKLTAAQMSGGCFSISSLGGIGGTYFTPIINAPEVAILGVSKARTQLVWNGREAEPRLMLPLSLSWDHRALDGAMAGRFNALLVSLLADFRRVML